MPKDTLKQLDLEVERMLFAGAQIARTNPDILAAKAKLAPLGAKVPVLGKVAEQIGKLEQATGKAAASELLGLSSLLTQVRGAQAAPAPSKDTGDLEALPPAVKIGSPLLPAELQTLVAALTNAPDSKHRAMVIRDCALRGSARDLRILTLCVPALSDTTIADVVEFALLPAIGDAIVPELRRALDIEKGRSLDQRLLRAIARIEGSKALDVIEAALQKGNAEMRAMAIAELGRIDAAAAEPIATSLFDKDRSKEVRLAAIRALSGATGDYALDVLLKAFGGSTEMRSVAESSLAVSKHPQATSRLIALLTPELRDLGHFRIKKATTKQEKDEAAKAQRAHSAKVAYLVDLVDLVAVRGTGDAQQVIIDVFRSHRIKEVRDSAARALLRAGYPGAWEELAPSLYEAKDATKYEFIDGILALDAMKAYDKLEQFFEKKALLEKNGEDFASRILIRVCGSQIEVPTEPDEIAASFTQSGSIFERDPRWVDLAIRLLPNSALRGNALALLTHTTSPKALESALAIANAPDLLETHATTIIMLLGQYRDARVFPAFIRLLDLLRGAWAYGRACEIFRQYDDPTFAPLLRTWFEEKKKRKRLSKNETTPFEKCLTFLTRTRGEAAADA